MSDDRGLINIIWGAFTLANEISGSLRLFLPCLGNFNELQARRPEA